MPKLKLHKHRKPAFSLLEAVICIVIMGVIGIICSSMLLQVSKNIAYTKAKNDSSIHIALLKIENLLQYAIIESIKTENGSVFNAPSSTLVFYRIIENALFGGGTKNDQPLTQGDTLLPNMSLFIDSHNDNLLSFASLRGWHEGQEAYLITKPHDTFKPYYVKNINANILTLDRKPTHTPHLMLPIQSHNLSLQDNVLLLDNAPLAFNVSSFIATPTKSPQGDFISLELCIKTSIKIQCESSIVWLDSIVEILP